MIATNEQAILCHWVGLRQYKEFGRAALNAIELLVLVRVRSSHGLAPFRPFIGASRTGRKKEESGHSVRSLAPDMKRQHASRGAASSAFARKLAL